MKTAPQAAADMARLNFLESPPPPAGALIIE